MTDTKSLAITAAEGLKALQGVTDTEYLTKKLNESFDAFDAFIAAEGTAEEFLDVMFMTGAAYGDREMVVSMLEDFPEMLKGASEELKEAGVPEETITRWNKFADDFDTLFDGFE